MSLFYGISEAQQLQEFLEVNRLGDLYPLLAEKNITNISDLVIFLVYPESLNVLELSSASVSELMKVLELRIEFFNQGGQVKLEQEDFFFKYTSINSLQRTTWAEICQSMKEQFDYNGKKIIREIWSSDSTLRKSLLDEYLPAHLADVLEIEGVRSIGDIPSDRFDNFSEGLTTSERTNLKKVHQRLNQSTSQKLKELEEAERKTLYL